MLCLWVECRSSICFVEKLNCKAKQEDSRTQLSSDTIQSVVEQVVGRLPMFITPVVEQSVSTILKQSLSDMFSAIIEAAVKKVKIELGYATSPGKAQLHQSTMSQLSVSILSLSRTSISLTLLKAMLFCCWVWQRVPS